MQTTNVYKGLQSYFLFVLNWFPIISISIYTM